MTGWLLSALGAPMARGLLGGPVTTLTPPACPICVPPTDGIVTATQAAIGATDLSAIALAIVIAAAFIGLARGARRELATLIITLTLSFVIGRLWAALAWSMTRLWNIAAALVPGGLLSPTVLPTDNAANWQVGFFLVSVVVLAYGGSRMIAAGVTRGSGGLAISSALERAIGAGLGAMTGFVVARFVLSRVLPGAVVSPFSAGSRLAERVQSLGPRAALGIMLLVLVLGALSIGSLDRGPRQKVYN